MSQWFLNLSPNLADTAYPILVFYTHKITNPSHQRKLFSCQPTKFGLVLSTFKHHRLKVANLKNITVLQSTIAID
jgi:hypothetical protein